MSNLNVFPFTEEIHLKPAYTHLSVLYAGPQGRQGAQGVQGADGAVAGYHTQTAMASTELALHVKTDTLENAIEDWQPLDRRGSWINYIGDVGWRACRYRKIDGMVYLEGLISNHTLISTLMAEFPAGYRPVAGAIILPTIAGNTTGIARVDVQTNGEMHHISGDYDWISLNGLCFATV